MTSWCKCFILKIKTGIGLCSFQSCHEFKQVDFTNNIKYIKSRAFNFCKELKQIDFPESLVKVWGAAFYAPEVKDVNVSDYI